MSLQVTVRWHLVGDREVEISYRVGPIGPSGPSQAGREEIVREEPADRVLPLGSSVVTPGLSIPLASYGERFQSAPRNAASRPAIGAWAFIAS